MSEGKTVAGVLVPTPTTLKRYGLDEESWAEHVYIQGGVCGACGKLPQTRRLVIDHEHVRGWAKMSPERRKLYVRGLLCWSCNHYRLARGATVENLQGAANYLADYLMRRPT